jgi:hypothetical protein
MRKKMQRILLSFCFISLFLLRGGAQTLSLIPQTSNVSVNIDSFEVRAKVTLKNTSNQTKRFAWQRNILSMTSTWQSMVCDMKGGCSFNNASSEKIELAPNATANFEIVVRANRQLGAATIEFRALEIGNESNVATSRFLFSTATGLRDYSKVNTGGVRIYPNPALDFFMLMDENSVVDRVVVYNIIGRQVKNIKAVENIKYAINDLPEGIYIIRLLNTNGVTIKTVRLNKAKAKA